MRQRVMRAQRTRTSRRVCRAHASESPPGKDVSVGVGPRCVRLRGSFLRLKLRQLITLRRASLSRYCASSQSRRRCARTQHAVQVRQRLALLAGRRPLRCRRHLRLRCSCSSGVLQCGAYLLRQLRRHHHLGMQIVALIWVNKATRCTVSRSWAWIHHQYLLRYPWQHAGLLHLHHFALSPF